MASIHSLVDVRTGEEPTTNAELTAYNVELAAYNLDEDFTDSINHTKYEECYLIASRRTKRWAMTSLLFGNAI